MFFASHLQIYYRIISKIREIGEEIWKLGAKKLRERLKNSDGLSSQTKKTLCSFDEHCFN
jgi:hypothetical protein